MFPTRTTAFLAACAGMLLAAPSALAASSTESTPLNLPSTDQSQVAAGGGGGLVRTFVGLAIVLAVIYGLYWVLKQVRASKDDRASGHGLRPLATLPLGPNRSLQLVRTGREVVLVGVGEAGVTPIRTYSEAEAQALGLLEEDGDDGEPPPARCSPGSVPRGRAGRACARRSGAGSRASEPRR